MYMKRKCIFTNKPADSKFTIDSDKQNWAKSVPCTKEYLTERGDKPPTELEIRLIELFYEQELCRLRIEYYITQMDEIRALMSKKLPITPLKKPEIYQNVELTQEDIDWMNAPMGPPEVNYDTIRSETAKVEVPDGVKEFVGLKEQVTPAEEMTQNFKEAAIKSGIADKLYNKDLVKGDKELTKEEEPVKVEKKVVKKKSDNLWD